LSNASNKETTEKTQLLF
jgi:hypothetical protein